MVNESYRIKKSGFWAEQYDEEKIKTIKLERIVDLLMKKTDRLTKQIEDRDKWINALEKENRELKENVKNDVRA